MSRKPSSNKTNTAATPPDHTTAEPTNREITRPPTEDASTANQAATPAPPPIYIA